MSVPARTVRARPAATPRARTTPSHPKLRVVPPRARRKRRAATGFWILTGVVLGGMIVVLTVMYALLAQGSYEMSELSEQQRSITRANTDLRIQIEDLSSTKQISGWAEANKLVMPAGYEVITAADIRSSFGDGPSRERTGGDG